MVCFLLLYRSVQNLLCKLVVTAFSFFLLNSPTLYAAPFSAGFNEQNQESPSSLPTLYLDCQQCDYNYIRQELRFVNYVRDQQQADIHLFITAQVTGDGGTEYELSFFGQEYFSEMNYIFTHNVGRDMTSSEIRESLNVAIVTGLAPFLKKASLDEFFTIQYDEPDETYLLKNEINDPWNNWVFELYAGNMQFNMESNQRRLNTNWGFFADRLTDTWRIHLRPYFAYILTEIDHDDKTHRHVVIGNGFNSHVVKSLTDHWSTGLYANYTTRTDLNFKHRLQINPGIEYNVFPYREVSRRSIVFNYSTGYTYADYFDLTIFNKTRENLFNHRLQAIVNYHQPWGSINAGLTGSQYFHDSDLRRLASHIRLSIRLVEGLSLSFQSNFDIIRDQLALRAGDLELEDIILAQQEMATDFSFSGLIAISYTFGSDFANVVNTRFRL